MIVENVVNKGYCLEDEVRSYCGNGKCRIELTLHWLIICITQVVYRKSGTR